MQSPLVPRMITSLLAAELSPAGRRFSPLAARIAAVLLGSALLALSSRIEVPMVPVPITMQTFAVTFLGAIYGWRLGATAVLVWLAEGAMGMPVFAGGGGGLLSFVGPTAGYLLAFPLVAALTGWLAERGCDGRRPGLAFGAMLAGNLLCLVLGAAWLATLMGAEKALMLGVVPFLVGAVLKSALAAVVLRLMQR